MTNRRGEFSTDLVCYPRDRCFTQILSFITAQSITTKDLHHKCLLIIPIEHYLSWKRSELVTLPYVRWIRGHLRHKPFKSLSPGRQGIRITGLWMFTEWMETRFYIFSRQPPSNMRLSTLLWERERGLYWINDSQIRRKKQQTKWWISNVLTAYVVYPERAWTWMYAW